MQNQEIVQIIKNLKGRRNYEEKKKRVSNVNISLVCNLYYILFCSITFGEFWYALEVFAVLSAIAIFLISKIRYKIK